MSAHYDVYFADARNIPSAWLCISEFYALIVIKTYDEKRGIHTLSAGLPETWILA